MTTNEDGLAVSEKVNIPHGRKNENGCNIHLQKTHSWFNKAMEHVNLEPMLFMKNLADGNILVVSEALKTDRICHITFNFSHDECMAMDSRNQSHIEGRVQMYQNTFNYYQRLLGSLLPVLVIMFAGSISDHYGRKLPMAIVLGGYVLFALVYVATALNPDWPVEVLFAASVVLSLTGTWCVFQMAVYSYLTDITTIETRTKRMGWSKAVWNMGEPIGTFMGSGLYQSYGYATAFTVSAVLWLACLLYVIFVLKESIVTDKTTSKNAHFRYVFDLVRVPFMRYPLRGRRHLLSLMAIDLGVFLIIGINQLYLWARQVLSWSATQYSTWFGTNAAVRQICMVVWVGMASYYHLSDYTVAIVALSSNALWSITLACITGPSLWWLTIIATALGALEGSIKPALCTLITTIPDQKDIGKIFAFLGLLECIWRIVDQTLYTYVYNVLVESFPQIIFVLGGIFSIILIVALVILKRDWSKQRAKTTSKSEVTTAMPV